MQSGLPADAASLRETGSVATPSRKRRRRSGLPRLVQNNRNPVISNQIAERPIRGILGLRDVTLSWNVQTQHEKRMRSRS